MREADALAQGSAALAKVVGYATHAMEPALFTVGSGGGDDQITRPVRLG